MNKTTHSYTFLKVTMSIAILFLVAMLYWSTLLLEEDLKKLTSSIRILRQDIENLRSDTHKQTHLLLEGFSSQLTTTTRNEGRSAKYPHMDPNLPNLLEKDPFYKETLPQLLGANFPMNGMRHETRLGRPENFHPFNPFADAAHLIGLCSGSIAKMQFGKYETLTPFLALKLEAKPLAENKGFEYWVYLRDDIYWKPLKPEFFPRELQLAPHFLKKHKVTAADFKFYYDAIMNPNVESGRAMAIRDYLGDIEEFRIVDPLTFVVRWKQEPVYSAELGKEVLKVRYTAKGLTGGLQPLPQFIFQYFADGRKIIEEDDDPTAYQTNSVWAQNFSHHWAKNIIPSCGPWQFEGFNDEEIVFEKNPDFFEPYHVLVKNLTYTFKESLEGVWQDFKAGKTDMVTLAPNQLSEYEEFLKSPTYLEQKIQGLGIKEIEYVDKSYFYIGWNQATPFFADREVRRAMTMAIDRNRIISHNLNEMGVAVTGPFNLYSPAYDESIVSWPYDPDEAKRLLDLAGWIDRDGDGIRDKIVDGKLIPFRFTLSFYAKSYTAKVVSEYISTTLKEIGIDCRLNGMDVTDISRKFEDKSFDALYMGWSLPPPPEEPRQIWHSKMALTKGSSNAIGFSHAEADKIIETLEYEYDSDKRLTLYHRLHQIIHEEAPYTFLYSPKVKLLYREYVKNLFIPRDRQDLIPGANIGEPDSTIIYLEKSFQ